MPPLVLLAGMNCTADLWTGCGLDDALTPVARRSTSVDDRSTDCSPNCLRSSSSAGSHSARSSRWRWRSRAGAGRGASVSCRRTRRPLRPRSYVDGRRGSSGSTPERARATCRPASCPPCCPVPRRATDPELVERTLAMADGTGRDSAARRSCRCRPRAWTCARRCGDVRSAHARSCRGRRTRSARRPSTPRSRPQLPRGRVRDARRRAICCRWSGPMRSADSCGRGAAARPEPRRSARSSPRRPARTVSRAESAGCAGAT